MIAVLVGLALGLLDWRVVRGNMGAVWNGLGAVPGTVARTNQAPMRYRVLMAWLARLLSWLGLLGQRSYFRAWHYQVVKTVLLAGALCVAERLLGTVGMLVVAVGIAVTLEFDYWSSYGELLGVGLVLLGIYEGCPYTVAAGGVVWGLSKETAVLSLGLVVLGAGEGAGTAPLLAGLVGPATMALVRLVQGKAELYCVRWTLRAYNVGDLLLARKRQDVGPWMSVAWTVVCVGVIGWKRIDGWGGVMEATAPVGLVWLLAGWLMARARETRVFLPTVLWMAAVVVG